jgi:hypothetical protein
LGNRFVPNKVVWRHNPQQAVPSELTALVSGKTSGASGTSLFVCREGVCQSPVVGAEAITAAIAQL